MGLSWTMDKIGPICRGVEDCAAALNAIYGPDGKDITVGDAPFNWNPDTNISTLRIGYLKTEFDGPPDAAGKRTAADAGEQRRALYKTALEVLEKAGAKLTPIELPKFSAGSLRFILSAEAATAFDDITRDGRVNQLSGQSPAIGPTRFARRDLFRRLSICARSVRARC
jgi:Asp-tRNA(Asn)/Glu-tRNA(Gln) amidotransferase A subunit family amidase